MIYKNLDDTLFMGDIRTDSLEKIAQYMGYDNIRDPDQLQGFIQNMAAKIKGAIQRSREKRGGESGSYAIQTPSGTVSVTDTGSVSAVTPKTKAASTKAKTAGIMEMIQNNPMIVLAAGAVVVFLMSQKKR